MTKIFAPILLMLATLAAFGQATFRAPTVYKGTVTTSIYWTAGTIYNGGHAITITAGNAALDASRVSCAAPTFATCDFLYSNNAGTVAVTTTLATAVASGNSLLAMIETGANSVPTSVMLPQNSGTLWLQAAGPAATGLTALTGITALTPNAAGTVAVGSNTYPYTGLYFGTAGTNNFFLTGAATSALRTITIPDFGATDAFGLQDPNTGTKQLLIALNGATGASTITSSLLASRTITLADPGGAAATIAYSNPTTQQVMTNLGQLTPSTTGVAIGTAANPWGSLVLGTAATNVVTVSPTVQAAARTVSIPDYGVVNQNFPGTVFVTGSNYTNATTGFTSVTGLAFPAAASTNYTAVCHIAWQGGAGTAGPKYQFTGPSAPTAVQASMWSNVTTSTYLTATATAFSSAMANSGTVTASTTFNDTVTVSVINSTNAGTVQLQAAANGTGTLTIYIGSYCSVQ